MLQFPRLRTAALLGVAAIACSSWLGAYFGAAYSTTAVLLACWFLFLGATMVMPRAREAALCALLGAFFAAMRTLGYSYDQLDSYGMVLKSAQTLVTGSLACIALFAATFCACVLLLRLLERLRRCARRQGNADAHTHRRIFWLCAAMIFLGGIPYLLLYWPGLNIYDTHDQILQFFGYPSYIGDGSALSDHHPVALTVLYSLFMKLGLALGDANIGQALYSLLSMLTLALCFALAYARLYDMGLSARFCIGLGACTALYPVLALYSFNMCKDVSAAPFVLLLTVCLLRMEQTRGVCVKSRRFCVQLVLSLFGLMLTRKPSLYALAFAAPFLLVRYRGVCRRLLALLLGPILAFAVGVNGLLLPALGVIPGETREMLSIPFQQTARYLRTYGEDVTQQELESISRVLDVEYAVREYDPRLSDPVKDTSNPDMTTQDLAAYARAWLSMGLRHPGVYLDAWLNMIYGYFYPSDSNTIVCLTLNSPEQGGLSLRQSESGAQARLELHNTIYFTLRRIPGVGALFYVDTIVWAFLFLLLALLLRDGAGALCPMMYWVGTLGICMLSPKSGEIRYLMPILYVLPVLLGAALIDSRKGGSAHDL